jgi:hypothetical protein
VRKSTVLCAIAALACGCKHDPSLVGKWTGDIQSDQVSVDLQPDETATIAIKIGGMGADITGKYVADSKNLTLNLDKYKLKNVPDAMVPAANTALEGFTKQPLKGTYHFNSEDELALTYNGKTDIWKRVKEGE